MSEFEFISVLMSMVIGLGIAHLLQGFAQAVHERNQAPVESTHMVWTAGVFVNLVLNWWVFFSWRINEVWSFGVFLMLIVWAMGLYLMVVFLYPPQKTAEESWADVYESNRPWFLASFAGFGVADIALTAVRGGLWDPPGYLPFVLHYIALFTVGVFVARPGYQRFLAWYVLTTITVWALVARRLLT